MFSDKTNKSILVFLPGLAEIFQFMEYIHEFYSAKWVENHLDLIPLHSSLN